MARETYNFGDFVFDVDAHRLTRRGERVELPPLSFDLLLCLVRAAPDSVSRETLTETLWPDTVVGDETLTERVKLLRRELETGDDERMILTERGWGYRLAITPEGGSEEVQGTKRSVRPSIWLAVVVVAVLAALLSTRTGDDEIVTLALLPFADLTADRDAQYIATGVAEELNIALARMNADRLLVLGATTSASIRGDAESAKALGVDYLLDGSVRDRNNTRVIAVRLTRVADSRQVWSYDAPIPESGSLRWQRDLINEVAIALTINAEIDDPPRQENVSGAARDAYLRGRWAWKRWTRGGFAEALGYFEQAIELQPDYVDAHAGLADVLGTLAYSGALPSEEAFERARSHATLALDLSPTSARARSSLAMVKMFADWDPAAAGEELSELLRMDPNNERLLLAMANVRWAQGCYMDAAAHLEHATRVDPHSPIIRAGLAMSYYLAGDYAEARTQAAIVLDAEPGYLHAVFIASMSATEMGDHQDALQLLEQAGVDDLVSARGYALAAAGDRSAASELLDRRWGERAYLARARLLAVVGRPGDAADEIAEAVERREPSAILAGRYPALREIPLRESVEAELARLDGDCL